MVGLAALFCIFAVGPRPGHKQPKGLIYWAAIKEHPSREEYASTLAKQSRAELDTHVSQHVFELAGIASKKYAWLNRALWLGIPSALITLAALFIK